MCSHDFFEFISERLRKYLGFYRVYAVDKCVYCGDEECYGTTQMQYSAGKKDKRYHLFKKSKIIEKVTKKI